LPIEPARALRALEEQLTALDFFKGKHFDEVRTAENEWEHFTQSVIEATFGDDSSNMSKFHRAGNAGELYVNMPPQQVQKNFELRIKEYEALLRSLIRELKLRLPEEPTKGIYQPGDQYGFYRDLSGLFAAASLTDVFLIDPYLDEKVFNLYVEKVPATAGVRILTNDKHLDPNLVTVAKMFASGRTLALRTTRDIHDRVVVFDDRCWVIGQSIKDAARTKPTYMVEIQEPMLSPTKALYENIWQGGSVII